MRILVLSNLFPPNVVGGYERLCHAMCAELAARGHAVTVLTSRHGGKVAEYPGLTVLREWELRTGADIYAPYEGTAEDAAALAARNLAALHRALDAVRPDVVFAWNLFFLDAALLDALEAGPHRCVVMLTDNWLLVMRNPQFVATYFLNVVHGGAPFAPPPEPTGWRAMLGRVRHRLGREEPKRGLEAIFGSRFMRDFHAAGGIRFARERVVHNGVCLPDAGTPPDRARLVHQGELRLLFAGRLVDLKGAHVAVAALARLDPAALGVARVVLTVVGDAQGAAYLARFHAAVAESGRAADVVLQPAVPEAALPALFAAHDIYLFPSLYEPFSLTLIHALASGIPTIASRAGGNPEIVAEGETGLLCQPGDAADLARAVARLARNPALRARVSRHGVEAARRFTFRRMADGMESFLEETA